MLAEQFEHLLFLILFDERWKEVPGFEGFEASTHGRARNSKTGIIRKPGLSGGGCQSKRLHLNHSLYCNGYKQTKSAHRLVLETFVGPRPDGMEGCHNDGDPSNNHVWNLRWDTHLNNMADMKRHGKHRRQCQSRSAGTKMTEADVLEIRRLAKEGRSQAWIARRFKIHPTTTSRIVLRKDWKHL